MLLLYTTQEFSKFSLNCYDSFYTLHLLVVLTLHKTQTVESVIPFLYKFSKMNGLKIKTTNFNFTA